MYYELNSEDREIYLDLFCGWTQPKADSVQHPDEITMKNPTDEEKAALAYER